MVGADRCDNSLDGGLRRTGGKAVCCRQRQLTSFTKALWQPYLSNRAARFLSRPGPAVFLQASGHKCPPKVFVMGLDIDRLA